MKTVSSNRRDLLLPGLLIAVAMLPLSSGAQTTCPVTAKVHDIQGSPLTQLAGGAHNDVAPYFGLTATVEGVVVGSYQSSTQLRGFFVQEEAADEDGDPTTSEGIFVFSGSSPSVTVVEGDRVCVTGMVSESLGMTRISTISGGSIVRADSLNHLGEVATAHLDLPITGDVNDFYEAVEGMRVTFTDALVVTDTSDLDRFGAVTLVAGARTLAYTQSDDSPSATEYAAYLAELTRRQVLLDDDDDTQYSSMSAGVFPHPQPAGLGTGTHGTDFFRAGDSVSNLTGVVSWTNGGVSGLNAWRLRPVVSSPATFAVDNPRTGAPAAAIGDIRVVGLNAADYFTTIDTTGGFSAPRGADSAAEFERQSAKLVAALAALDADVIGIAELENNAGVSLGELANRLNAHLGSTDYQVIVTGQLGIDAVAVGLIYRASAVTPAGAAAVLIDPVFTTPNGGSEPRNRPAVAQTFAAAGGAAAGELFTVVMTHFMTRDPLGATALDLDQGDGQGAFNDTRAKAAAYLVGTWLASDPTGQGDTDVLVIGDLNAYRGEAPLTAFRNGGFSDLIELYQGADAYSAVTTGRAGYLDHALATATLVDQVVNAAIWHINADEIELFDYNDTVQDYFGEQFAEVKPAGRNLYAADEYRSAERDPVIVDLALTPQAPPPPPLPPPPPAVERGDADGDGDIDRDDLKLISRTKREPAAGSDDPNDVDGDGYITQDDVKLARERCTRHHCATELDGSAAAAGNATNAAL